MAQMQTDTVVLYQQPKYHEWCCCQWCDFPEWWTTTGILSNKIKYNLLSLFIVATFLKYHGYQNSIKHTLCLYVKETSCRLRFSPWLNVWHDIPKSNELLNNFLWCKVCSIPGPYSLNANSTLHHCGNKIIKCQIQSWVLIVFSQQKHRKSGSDVSTVFGWSEDHF